MLGSQLGFKSKLRIVITLAVIGFVMLTAISFHALQTLGDASQHVDNISRDVNLLKNLQIDVLQLNDQTNAKALQQLLTQYEAQLDQLAQKLPPQQAETIGAIHQSLENWISGRLQGFAERQRIGFHVDDGLRGEVGSKLYALEEILLTYFRKSFSDLKQTLDAFVEHRGEKQYQQVNKALETFNQSAMDLGMGHSYGPKLVEVKASFAVLGEAIFAMNKQDKHAQEAYELLAEGVASSNLFLDQQLVAAKSDAVNASEQAQSMIIGVCIAVALLVVGLLIRISNDVVSALESMSNVLYKLADGDLTQRLHVNEFRRDELDKVSLAVNEMTASLSQVITRVTQSSQTLDRGAADLSENLVAMVDNNSSTNDQADSVATATEEICSTIQDMASATDAAHQKAQQAQVSADQGGEVITSAIDSLGKLAMVFDDLNCQVDELETASRKVDGVTEMINGLAEQTNLLALNAAIEAARAGEAGRGFSVVADEVRSLAEKTVQATQHITDIIGAMHSSIQSLLKMMAEGSGHVDSGRELGDKAAVAVEQIKYLVLDVTHRNQELTVNIEEASKATQMIAENMDQVASNVSQNKEQSQEVQQYVDEVSGRATELLVMTERFRCRSEDSVVS